jgi:long-chain fatty acid transport protein
MKRALILLLASQSLIAAPALAAGFGLKEQSAKAMGAAYAGVAASDQTAADVAYNPAALAGVGDGADFAVSAVEILPSSSANYTVATTAAGTPASGTHTPHGFISDASVPNIGVRYRLSDAFAAGLNVSVPYGLKTNYPTSWAGRYYGQETMAVTVDIAPSLAWQVTPELSLGAALDVEYARGELTSAIDIGSIGASLHIPGSVPGALDGSARLSGMDWSTGFSLGVIDKLTPDITLGLAYHSAIHHTLAGPLTYTLDPAGLGAGIRAATSLFTNTRATAKLATPDMIQSGARILLDDNWTALMELDWTHWSEFRNLTAVAQNPAQPNDVTLANWNDAVFISAGAEYALNDVWKLRGGVAYDQSPVPDATRNIRIPDANRTWLALGVDYRLTPATGLSLSYGHLFNSDEPIAQSNSQTGNALRGNLAGVTKSAVNTIGLEFTGAL